ncbi:unnamed protein product, partial [marine sediment metagenome]
REYMRKKRAVQPVVHPAVQPTFKELKAKYDIRQGNYRPRYVHYTDIAVAGSEIPEIDADGNEIPEY